MKQYSTRDFKKILTNNGFIYDRSRGSHSVFIRGKESLTINNNINMMVARRLIKEYKLKEA